MPKSLKNSKQLQDRVKGNLFTKWYKLDENADPEEYRLRPLKDVGDKEFSEDSPILSKALESLEFEDGLLVGDSVTEYEVRGSMLLKDIN